MEVVALLTCLQVAESYFIDALEEGESYFIAEQLVVGFSCFNSFLEEVFWNPGNYVTVQVVTFAHLLNFDVLEVVEELSYSSLAPAFLSYQIVIKMNDFQYGIIDWLVDMVEIQVELEA